MFSRAHKYLCDHKYFWVLEKYFFFFFAPVAVSPLSPALSLPRSSCRLINKLRTLWFWSMELVCLGSYQSLILLCLVPVGFFGWGFQLRNNDPVHQNLLPPELKLAVSLPSVSSYNWTHRCNFTETHIHIKAHKRTHCTSALSPFVLDTGPLRLMTHLPNASCLSSFPLPLLLFYLKWEDCSSLMN